MSYALKRVHLYELIKLHARHCDCLPTTIKCAFTQPDDSLPVGGCVCMKACYECVREIDFCHCIS